MSSLFFSSRYILRLEMLAVLTRDPCLSFVSVKAFDGGVLASRALPCTTDYFGYSHCQAGFLA